MILLSSSTDNNVTEAVADAATEAAQTFKEMLVYRLTGNMKSGLLKTWLSEFLPGALSFAWSVLLAIVVYVIGVRVIHLILRVVDHSLTKRKKETGVIQFVNSFLRLVLYVTLFIIILCLFGVTASSVAAGVASLGVTAGLALQGSLSNIAGGVLILLFHPFRVGDYIIEDTKNNEGYVEEINMIYTRIRSIDNSIIVIPNGTLANASLVNMTEADMRQIEIPVSVSYEDDLDKAKAILALIGASEPKHLTTEPVKAFVRELGDSAVILCLRLWVPTDDYWDAKWRVTEEIKKNFDKAKIKIPYNQLDVHIKEGEA